MGAVRSVPSGATRTAVAATASWPSRKTVASIGTISPTTALAGHRPPSTTGDTSSTGMRPTGAAGAGRGAASGTRGTGGAGRCGARAGGVDVTRTTYRGARGPGTWGGVGASRTGLARTRVKFHASVTHRLRRGVCTGARLRSLVPVRAIRRFTVRTLLPAELRDLDELAHNLRWSWHAPTRDLFAGIDPETWAAVHGDPVALLGALGPERLAELAADGAFVERVRAAAADLRHYLDDALWYQERAAEASAEEGGALPAAIAYFSPEFGITSVLPQYSGGLGILAGDHLKSASDLGVPIVGVGLLYGAGYFKQSLTRDGWQVETYPLLDPDGLPLTLLRDDDGTPARVSLALPGADAPRARVGRGRRPRAAAPARLERARQRRGRAQGDRPPLRRRRRAPPPAGAPARRGRRARAAPVVAPHRRAGARGLPHQRGPRGVPRRRAHPRARRAGPLVRRGASRPCAPRRSSRRTRPFPPASTGSAATSSRSTSAATWRSTACPSSASSPSVPRTTTAATRPCSTWPSWACASAGGRTASRSCTARCRADVRGLWPGFDAREVPITSVTNGVHSPTWVDPALAALEAERLGLDELTAEHASSRWLRGDGDGAVGDGELWAIRREMRGRLVDEARRRVRKSWRERGATPAELGWVDDVLSPDVLTIGSRAACPRTSGSRSCCATRIASRRCCCTPSARSSSSWRASRTPRTTRASGSSSSSCASRTTPRCGTASSSCRTTTSPWRSRSTRAATSGSTTRCARSRRPGRRA